MRPPVPAEIALLGLSACLVVVQVLLPAFLGVLQTGPAWNAGPRDAPPPPPGILLGRARRALANLFETFPVFAVAVLAVSVTHRLDQASLIGANLYFWGRLVYLPLYLGGVPYIRSLVWTATLVGIFMVLGQLL
jgi:uncharacterized MAPEG superfamily protein